MRTKRRRDPIDSDPTVRRVAAALGIRSESDLRAAITECAAEKVQSWMEELRIEPQALDDVHQLVLNRTQIRVVRVDSDSDLQMVSARYKKEQPSLPVQLELEFRGDTEALVFATQRCDVRFSRFVAVVDARGSRRARAWFAERHEPSHLLIPDPTSQVVLRRTQAERPEPIEQVVDSIAARVGFWEPLVRPVVSAALRCSPSVLDALENARLTLAPDASIESSYRAYVRFVGTPIVLLRVAVASRREDSKPGGDLMGSRALRATTVIMNNAAEAAGMRVWNNYRIPAESVITLAHARSGTLLLSERDNLGRWRSERGGTLPPVPVRVTARGPWACLQLDG